MALPLFSLFCICCILPLASATWFALMRLLREPECPRNMRHALCNWGRLYGGTFGKKGSLVPSAKNPLWVDPNSSVAHRAMISLVDILQQGKPQDVDENLCHLIEEWLPRVGMNGLIDLIAGMEQASEHDSGEVWGIDLDNFTQELLDTAGDWKHDLGAYVIARLEPHKLLPLGCNSRTMLAVGRWCGQIHQGSPRLFERALLSIRHAESYLSHAVAGLRFCTILSFLLNPKSLDC